MKKREATKMFNLRFQQLLSNNLRRKYYEKDSINYCFN